MLVATLPIAAFVASVIAHVVVSRLWPRLPRHHGLLLGVVAGFAVLAALGTTVWPPGPAHGDRVAYPLLWGIAYLGLAYSYIFGFFNLGESARRIRLLIELHEAGDRGLTLDELLAAYNARIILGLRLERMLTGGQIVERDGRYFIGSRFMLATARLFVGLKLVFLGARSEFTSRT